jgi:hypothetical protein
MLLAVLGMFLALEKCQLFPQHRAPILGMVVETDHQDTDGTYHCRFILPEKKVAKLEVAGQQLLEGSSWTSRKLASFSGMLVFAYVALRLAPLLVRTLHLMLTGQLAWDEGFAPSELSKQQVAFILEYVRQFNGKRFFKRPETLRVAADYSSVHGHGAFVVEGSSSPEDRLTVALTPEEQQAAREHRLSSTKGELLAKEVVVDWLLQHPTWRQRLRHGHLVFEGDNQAAEAVVASLGGNKENFPIVARLYWKLAEVDCELSCQWASRDTPNQMEADRLSKEVDNADWILLQQYQQQVLQQELLQGRLPTLDPFASSISMMAPCSYTKVGCPGSSGVDGMGRTWAVPGPAGEKPLVWVYPDFGRMAEVVAKILHEQQDAVLIYPDWPRGWRATMMVPQRKADFQLGRLLDVSRPTSRAAPGLQQLWQEWQEGRQHGPAYKLRCAIFLF